MIISFIIPAYNASGTIVRCLDSIYSLSLEDKDFEIIVVDDCSMDNTVQIIEQYAINCSNLTLLRQTENHRQGAARNRGLNIAKGEYITFIDSDDIVLPDIVHAITLASKCQVDMIYSYMEIERVDSIFPHQLSHVTTTIMNSHEFIESYVSEGVFYYPPSYLYKKSFMDNINLPFIEDRQHEDRDWLASILVKANMVAIVPYFTYRYTFNPNSTCHYPRYSTVFDHVASGIRHLDLSEQVKENCPKLSQTLYIYNVIYIWY